MRTVQFYGVTTFTTGIFKTWYGMGDPVGAILQTRQYLVECCCLLLMVVLSAFQGGNRNITMETRGSQPALSFELNGWKAVAAFFGLFSYPPPVFSIGVYFTRLTAYGMVIPTPSIPG